MILCNYMDIHMFDALLTFFILATSILFLPIFFIHIPRIQRMSRLGIIETIRVKPTRGVKIVIVSLFLLCIISVMYLYFKSFLSHSQLIAYTLGLFLGAFSLYKASCIKIIKSSEFFVRKKGKRK